MLLYPLSKVNIYLVCPCLPSFPGNILSCNSLSDKALCIRLKNISKFFRIFVPHPLFFSALRVGGIKRCITLYFGIGQRGRWNVSRSRPVEERSGYCRPLPGACVPFLFRFERGQKIFMVFSHFNCPLCPFSRALKVGAKYGF